MGQGDVACLGEVEHRVAEILQEGYGRLEVALQLHLRLVDLAQVHQFVDESEHTVGIAIDEFEGLLVFRAVVSLHEFLERADDEGHWCTELMGDVHEELQLGIVDGILALLFGLEATFGTLTTDELIVEPDDECEDGTPQQDGPPGEIPWALDEDVDGLHFGSDAFLFGLETEGVVTGREVAERDEVHGRRQGLPCVIVHRIAVNDGSRQQDGTCSQFDGERVVLVADVIVAVLVGADVVLGCSEANDTGRAVLHLMGNLARIEPGDAHGATEPECAIVVAQRCVLVELAALQAILGGVDAERLLLQVELGETGTATYPQVAFAVGLGGKDVVAWKTILRGVGLEAAGLGVEHDQTIVGTEADFGGRTTSDAVDDDGAEEVFGFAAWIVGMIDDQTIVGAKVDDILDGVVAEGSAPVG